MCSAVHGNEVAQALGLRTHAFSHWRLTSCRRHAEQVPVDDKYSYHSTWVPPSGTLRLSTMSWKLTINPTVQRSTTTLTVSRLTDTAPRTVWRTDWRVRPSIAVRMSAEWSSCRRYAGPLTTKRQIGGRGVGLPQNKLINLHFPMTETNWSEK